MHAVVGLDKSTVSRRVHRAADGGYVRNLEDKRGKPGRWVIGDPLPETVDLLPEPAQLRNTLQPPDQDRCSVAVGSDGERAGSDGTRPCGICGTTFHPDPPSRAVCDQCRPHLAGTIRTETA